MPIDNPQTPEEYAAYLEEWNKILEEFNQMLARQKQGQQSQQNQGGMEMGLSLDSLTGGGGSSVPSIGGGTAAGGTGVSSGAGAAGGGGGSAAGSSAAGMGAAGLFAAIVAGMTALQEASTRSQDRTFEGQESGNYFDRSFFTEPWYANLVEKMGLNATSGEKMDAAIKNKDWSKVARRTPAALDYWADPIRQWIGSGVEGLTKKVTGSGTAGKVVNTALDPFGGLLKLIGK